MSGKDGNSDAQQEQREQNPWAPPGERVSLDKPDTAAVPPQAPAGGEAPAAASDSDAAPVQDAAAAAAPAAPAADQPAGAQAVPPIPQAPTGPGTPSAYQGGPYPQYPQHPQHPQHPQPPYWQGGIPGPHPQQPQGAYAPGPYGYAQPAYGTAWGAPGWQPAQRAMPDNALGTAALVLGIVGTVFAPTVLFGVILGVLAIVLGAIGRNKAKTGLATNGGQALAGLVLGGVALLATALMLALYITAASHHSSRAPDDDPDATYGAYMHRPAAPGPLVLPARR
ncbi:DUF4190 domain-containing protein [Streptomyces sp. NPDC002536]